MNDMKITSTLHKLHTELHTDNCIIYRRQVRKSYGKRLAAKREIETVPKKCPIFLK